MDIKTLKDALKIVHQAVTIAPTGALNTPEILTLLKNCYQNKSITILNAKTGPGETDQNVVIEGTADFLGLGTSTPVLATFSLDGNQKIIGNLKYTIIPPKMTAQTWKFSNSFPDLPVSFDFKTSLDANQLSILDKLYLGESYFITSINDFVDPTMKVDVKAGINFLGYIDAAQSFPSLSWLTSSSDPIILYGTITYPTSTAPLPPLPFGVFPWDTTKVHTPVPGIMLQANLVSKALPIGNAQLQDNFLKIFSPITSDWLTKNTDYTPVSAFGGTLKNQTGTISATLTSKLLIGVDAVTITSDFTGLSLKNLTDLADISGKTDLLKSMPSELQSLVSNITLEEAAISLLKANNLPKINYTYLTVGVPNINWAIIPGVKKGDKPILEVDNISSTFVLSNPFDNPTLSTSINGNLKIVGIPLEITTDYPGFFTQAELAEKQTVPLKTMLDQYLPGADIISDLTVDGLVINIEPSQSYSMSLYVAQDQAWSINVGLTTLNFKNIVLALAHQVGGSTSGTFSGQIEIAGNTLDAEYSTPGNFTIHATFPEINVSKLIETLCNNTIKIPFDLVLKNSTILLDKSTNNFKFMLATQLDTYGSIAFEVIENANKWGFAFGINIGKDAITKLDGLSGLSIFTDVFNITELGFIVSSVDQVDFQFPDLTRFSNPAITSKKINFPAATLAQGLTLYAQVTLGATGHQDLLSKFLKVKGELDFVLSIGADPAKNSTLSITFPQVVFNSDTNLTGQIVVGVKNSQLEFGLAAIFKTKIQGAPAEFDVMLVFMENGAFLSGTMKGTINISFLSLKVTNLALEVGIDLEGVPSFGFAGEISSKDFDIFLAVFANSENPAQSMLAGSVSNISLYDIITTIAGTTDIPSAFNEILKEFSIQGTRKFTLSNISPSDFDNRYAAKISTAFKAAGITIPNNNKELLVVVNKAGEHWTLTDKSTKNTMPHYQVTYSSNAFTGYLEAQLYVVPQATQIGTITFDAGFSASGAFEILGVTETIDIEIDASKGIYFSSELSPINLEVAGITLLSITGDGQKDAEISLCTYTKNNSQGNTIVQPHFKISGKVNLVDLISGAIDVSITNNGFIYDFSVTTFGCKFDVNAHFKTIEDFGSNISIFLGLKEDIDIAEIGKVNIDIGINADMGLNVSNSSISAHASGGFEFEGVKLTIVDFKIDVNTKLFSGMNKILGDAAISVITSFLTSACPMTTLFTYLPPTADPMLLSKSAKGKSLLYHYYTHREEIEQLLETTDYVKPKLIVLQRGPKDNTKGHITLVIEILDLILPHASPELAESIQDVMPILEKGYGMNWDDFLLLLDTL